jgi:hypothetical protein
MKGYWQGGRKKDEEKAKIIPKDSSKDQKKWAITEGGEITKSL